MVPSSLSGEGCHDAVMRLGDEVRLPEYVGRVGMLSLDWVRRPIVGYNEQPTFRGTMATIDTADDLIEVLKSDDRLRSAVRRELLTEELLSLPGRFD